jgi:hypothetical protein
LCDGLDGALYRFDGELMDQVAHQNYTPEALDEARRTFPMRPSRALDTFPNPKSERDYTIVFDCPEFTCLCPITGQPDFATIRSSVPTAVRRACR